MNSEKYIGLDVHQATICVAVMDPKSMGFECYLVTTVIGSHLQRDAKEKPPQTWGGLGAFGKLDYCFPMRVPASYHLPASLTVYKEIRPDPVPADMLVPSHRLSEARGYEDCSLQMVL